MKHMKNFSLGNAQWKNSIPVPVYEEKPEYIDFYDRPWELAHDHVREIQGLPQVPYMDDAFCNTDMWIWDTCFMTFFCKYAPDVFPGIETLVNFYKIIHDAWPLPVVRVEDGKPPRKDDGPDDVKQLCLHIPDNPPLFAWAEFSYAMMTGDREHLRKLLLEATESLRPCPTLRSRFSSMDAPAPSPRANPRSVSNEYPESGKGK